MRYKFHSLALALVLAVGTPSVGAVPLLAAEQQMVDLINQTRAAHGVGALSLNDQLRNAALDHSLDMAQNVGLSHTGSNGSNFVQRIQASGYAASPFAPFELIAMGAGPPATILNLFLADIAHGAPLLAASVFDLGVGNAQNFWTVLLNPVQLTPVNGGGTPGNPGTGGVGGTPQQPLAIDPAACTGVQDPEARVLCLVNDVRTREGRSALTSDDDLAQAAAAHALDMLNNAFLSHAGSDGSTFASRALSAGYGGVATGELLGNGFASADTLVQAWLDDGIHRDLLLQVGGEEAGVEFLESGNSRLWVMVLGAPDAAQAPAPATLWLTALGALGIALSRRRLRW